MQKQNLFALILFFLFIHFAVAQVSFIPCTNCVYGPNDDATIVYQYDSIFLTMETEDITSDFGARRLSESCSPLGFSYDWHGGVDYRDLTSTNRNMGDAILALDGGQIHRVCGDPGIMYVVIDGQNYDYSLLHIFHDSDGELGPNGERKAGRYVMVPFNYNNSSTDTLCRYAIVDLQTNTAIAAIPDNCPTCVFTYDGITYSQAAGNLFNTIDMGEPVAPIGSSGGYFPHLHISEIINLNVGGNSIYGDNNTRDIWHLIEPVPGYDLNPTYFDLEFSQMNGTPGFEITYPGNIPSRFRVDATMTEFQHPGTNTSRYSNTLMAIETLELLLKKDFASDEVYGKIKGAEYQSFIEEGGISETSPDEAMPYPGHIHDVLGSWLTQGIRPYAYSGCQGNEGKDAFFFTDFITRIHKKDTVGGNVMIANCPQQTRYNDGDYHLKARLEDVRGHKDSLVETFNLDNFHPFVQKVKILANNNPNSVLYLEEWLCKGGCMTFSDYNVDPYYQYFELNNSIYVHVNTSEPMEDLTMDIYRLPFPPQPSNWIPVLEDQVAVTIDSSRQHWVFEFPTSPPSPLIENFFQFRFSGFYLPYL